MANEFSYSTRIFQSSLAIGVANLVTVRAYVSHFRRQTSAEFVDRRLQVGGYI